MIGPNAALLTIYLDPIDLVNIVFKPAQTKVKINTGACMNFRVMRQPRLPIQ